MDSRRSAEEGKLLAAVGCQDLYEFLGLDRDATLDELMKAACRQSELTGGRRGSEWTYRRRLAGMCWARFSTQEKRTIYDEESQRGTGRTDGGKRQGLHEELERRMAGLETATETATESEIAAAVGLAKAAWGSGSDYWGLCVRVVRVLRKKRSYGEALEFLNWCEEQGGSGRGRCYALRAVVFAERGSWLVERGGDGVLVETREEQLRGAQGDLELARHYREKVGYPYGYLDAEIRYLEDRLRTDEGSGGRLAGLGKGLIGVTFLFGVALVAMHC